MLKKLFICSVLVFSLMSQGIDFGLRAGINMAKPTFDGAQTEFDGDNSFLAGLTLNIDLLVLSLDADILYVENKLKGSAANTGLPVGGKSTQLQIPITAKFSLIPTGVKPYLRGGVAYSKFLKAENSDGKDIKDMTKDGLGIVVGAGIDLSLPIIPSFNVDARYIIPLKNSFEYTVLNQSLGYKISQFQLSLGFAF